MMLLDIFSLCWPQMLLPLLLSFLLGSLFGWGFASRFKKRISELESANAKFRNANSSLEADLSTCKSAKSNADGEISLLRGQLREKEIRLKDAETKAVLLQDKIDKGGSSKMGTPPFLTKLGGSTAKKSSSTTANKDKKVKKDKPKSSTKKSKDKKGSDKSKKDTRLKTKRTTGAASSLTSSKSAGASTKSSGTGKAKADNLKLIEGIGPKYEKIFKSNGVETFRKMSNTSPKKLHDILVNENPRYRMASTDTWPQQAKLAAEGKWDELKILQDRLDGGRK